jgi:hypothetical protein
VRLFLLSLAARGILVSAVFCILLGRGWWTARLSHRTALAFAALYFGGAVGFPYLGGPRWAFVVWIAVLDVVLAVLIYGREGRLKDWP